VRLLEFLRQIKKIKTNTAVKYSTRDLIYNVNYFKDYILKNCIQSIQCCISRRSKTAKI